MSDVPACEKKKLCGIICNHVDDVMAATTPRVDCSRVPREISTDSTKRAPGKLENLRCVVADPDHTTTDPLWSKHTRPEPFN